MANISNTDKSIVFDGELSESSDEELQSVEKSHELDRQAGVVVDGEASESSSEEDNTEPSTNNQNSPEHPKALEESVENTPSDKIENEKQKPAHKYNSLLHRKLREKNLQLKNHLASFYTEMYSAAAKDINTVSAQARKSHATSRDVSHTMRLVSNDLFQLEDKLDIVATCCILPDIKLPRVEKPTTPT